VSDSVALALDPVRNLPTGTGKKNARRLEGNGHFMHFEVLLLLIATLVARLAKQLAVLLLGHTLATLLNN